jgi:hypothetical protein
MAFLIEYQDDTQTYYIKHKDMCRHCKNRAGHSMAVMKVAIDDDGDISYTLKFKEIVEVETLRRLLPFLDQYIDEVIEGTPY